MDTVKDGVVVEMNYTLKDDQGEILDTTDGEKPFAYIQGNQDIVPGLEKEMAGKKVGDSFKVSVGPENGYGKKDENLIQSVPKEQFGAKASQVEVGMQFEVESEGHALAVTVAEVRENEIVLDGNHPLAGETLHFDVEVVGLRQATSEELENGLEKDGECCDHTDCC